MPFYVRKDIDTAKGLRFNLPSGEYDLRLGDIEQNEIVPYPLIKMDLPSDFTPYPEKLKLVYKPTPRKCQIDVYNFIVYADPMFKLFPKYVFKWVFGHELGHFPYKGEGIKSEKDCDLFSANLLLVDGYNPSQIRSAIDLALSNQLSSLCRKVNVLNNLKEVLLWTQY